jgi:thymidine phosphorylase
VAQHLQLIRLGILDGLIAALIHLGMPEEIATRLGERVHKGDTLVIVHAPSQEQAEKARAILAAHNPRTEEVPGKQGVVSMPPAA